MGSVAGLYKHAVAKIDEKNDEIDRLQAIVDGLRKRRFTVLVLPATAGEAKKYTVVCHGRDDAMLLAFALDGGWSAMGEIDASGMFALAEEYCEIISEEAAEAKEE